MRFNSKKLLPYSKRMLNLVANFSSKVLQSPTIRAPLAICLGACAGALSRYYLTLWFSHRFGSSLPYGTFFINLTGCFSMGFFTTLVLERVANVPPETRLLVAVGFLGAYTTFSTYGLDTFILLRNRSWTAALFYWAGSAVLGIVCLQLGVILARIAK